MKARNLTAIALALLLGAHAVGCSDDGGPEQTNNSLADAGDDTGIHDTGDEDADLADVGEDTADDVGEPDVADGGDIGVDTDLDTGVDADLDTDADADAGDPPPPPDDVDPLGGYWSEDYSVAGLVGPDGGVVDALLHNETTDEIYAAGGFTYAGTTEVTNIARWDGTQWQALGNGLQISVYALAQDAGGTLYAAGSGGGGFIGPSSNDMYSWDGTQWTNFASAAPGSSKIYDMVALSNGDLIVAGDFSGIEGVQANNVARWDGTNWTAIDANNEPDDRVYDITETGEGFCIGGYFENIGSTAAKGVACWNGTAWAQAGSGIDGRVHALHSIGGSELLAAGQFRLDGAYGLAKFDGTSWQGHLGGVAGGMVTDVRMLHEGPSGEIYVGGTFDYVGPSRTYSANIAKIDGGNWTALDTGVREKSRFTTGSVVGVNAAVSLNNGDLVVGGFFTNASDAFAPNLATWDDTSWSTLVNTDRPYLGADATVSTYASGPNGELYAGGWFGHIGPNGTPRVAMYDGTTWRPMSDGLAGSNEGGVRALAVDPSGTVYAGGEFQYAGANVVSWLAQWNGTEWLPVGAGLNGPVYDLAVGPNGKLYAAGAFTLADGQDVGGVAVWDGSNWTGFGGGFADIGTGRDGEEVQAVAVDPNGVVYAGGTFYQTSTYNTVKHLAMWDGAAWIEVSGSVEDHDPDTDAVDDHGVVYDLAIWGTDLVVAGNFAEAGGVAVNSIARWDGTNWHAFANGVPPRWQGGRPGTVFSVASKENGVFIATNQQSIDGLDVGFVGWWDGSAWHALDQGVMDSAEAVHVHDYSLYVGGPFIGASGVPSFHVARWRYDDNVVTP